MTDDKNPLAGLTLVGGRLCLDFVNTVDAYEPFLGDRLDSYADLVWWVLRVAALGEAEAATLFAAADAEPDRAAEVLARAVTVRAALFRVIVATRAGEAADGADLAVVNDALARALGHQRIVPAEHGFAWSWEDAADLERVLWPVVRDAADLLVSGELRRVGKCCGENCDWLYLDTSRNRSRRWCDMQSCGNRAKARRHYRKVKGGG